MQYFCIECLFRLQRRSSKDNLSTSSEKLNKQTKQAKPTKTKAWAPPGQLEEEFAGSPRLLRMRYIVVHIDTHCT